MSKEQTPQLSAKEFWKERFDEYPQTDADKLAVAMMAEYAASQATVGQQVGIIQLINQINKRMAEYYMRHDYRLMYELWNTFKDQVLTSPATVDTPVSGDGLKSKEDILEKHCANYRKYLNKDYGSLYDLCINGFECFHAMEEYANQFKQPPVSGKEVEELKVLFDNNAVDDWSAAKPELNKECFLLAASYWKNTGWECRTYSVEKIKCDEGWYWGVCEDGSEWGDYDDMSADRWKIIQLPKPPKQ